MSFDINMIFMARSFPVGQIWCSSGGKKLSLSMDVFGIGTTVVPVGGVGFQNHALSFGFQSSLKTQSVTDGK
jgi:hypothetical protein